MPPLERFAPRSTAPVSAPASRSDADEARENMPRIVAALKAPATHAKICRILGSIGIRGPEADARASEIIADAVAAVENTRADYWAKLARCTPESVVAGTEKIASLGLSPNYLNGDAYFRPGFNKDRKVWEAAGMPGLHGMQKLIFGTGIVGTLRDGAVREQDHFVYRETLNGSTLEHERRRTIDAAQANRIVDAFAIIDMKDGRRLVKVIQIDPASLTSKFMGEDVEARYRAQRAVMKLFSQTVLHDPSVKLAEGSRVILANLSALDREEVSKGTALEEAAPAVTNAAPKVEPPASLPPPAPAARPIPPISVVKPTAAPPPVSTPQVDDEDEPPRPKVELPDASSSPPIEEGELGQPASPKVVAPVRAPTPAGTDVTAPDSPIDGILRRTGKLSNPPRRL